MSKKQVLVVDDEELIGELCCSVFEDGGFEALYCSNITDALTAASKKTYDFILSDIQMPGGDGIEFKTELNKLGINTPFLFMTGFSSLPKEEVHTLSAVGIIKKPFSIDVLQKYINKFLIN
ncbi:MAG: response regulator [Bacteriovoracaceae bacterium]|jgi:DNA-binding NtrC family response regulator|nr:response regulator [Bacteriovoracaceae bacterium]